jgi:glycerol-3-phosphate dehydrogenase
VSDAPDPSRVDLLQRLTRPAPWDLVVIGGGATGLAVALDAAARGLDVALVEAGDFARGTSSRATKLLHGGVRYLAQGNIGLVREALRERTLALRNAPHLASPLPFVLPLYGARGRWIDRWFYRTGLTAYDWLSGSASLGATTALSASETAIRVPGLRRDGLGGALCYWDGQFDDARLAVAVARTALRLGAAAVNHCPVEELIHDGDRVAGVVARDEETGRRFALRSRCVVNATGVWVDTIRGMDRGSGPGLVTLSQGVHLVVGPEFLGASHAVLVPKTADGRVLFAVPWLGRTLLGTTDTPCPRPEPEPQALRQEVDLILGESARYLTRPPTRADVTSVWVGLRPLVQPGAGDRVPTRSLSREHLVRVDPSGLVTVTGGKWTTSRAMAESVLAACSTHGLIPDRPAGATVSLRLVGSPTTAGHPLSAAPGAHLYGTEGARVAALAGHGTELAPGLTEAMVRFAARQEQARTVEDVLARRSRLLFLDARLAAAIAPRVGSLLAEELGPGFEPDASVRAFEALAQRYATVP